VSKISPIKKSKKAKIMKGKKDGNKSIMNMGTEMNSQATVPQKTRPRVAKMINFFFVDRSMSFIDSLSANGCFTRRYYLPFIGGGSPTDAKEIKSAAVRS
jgi:hypothetical protein